jgi:hypothetical protein
MCCSRAVKKTLGPLGHRSARALNSYHSYLKQEFLPAAERFHPHLQQTNLHTCKHPSISLHQAELHLFSNLVRKCHTITHTSAP